jgi:DNA (cytosine-5)-methyltransferase 1
MPSLTPKRPIAVDLFSGVGGLSLGFEQAGFDVKAAVEFDPIHAAAHELNFPNSTVICRDVRHLTGDEIRSQAGIGRRAIDVVFGGPPCQGFSLIGHRVLDDPRNSLVFHFLRLVRELKPKTLVMENVPGMATGSHTALLSELISNFKELGYKIRLPYKILNAANYGVPQNRRRLFLLGSRADTFLPDYPEWKTTFQHDAKKQSNGIFDFGIACCPTAKDALDGLPNISEFERLFDTDELRYRQKSKSRYAQLMQHPEKDPEDFSYPRTWDAELITGNLRAEHTSKSIRRFDSTTPGETEPVSRFFRVPIDGICNTLRAGTATDRGAFSAPRPIHPLYPRCISVREAARLHSYPDWFRFHRTIWHGFRQIGNSVPPLLARAVASRIVSALGVTPTKPTERLPSGDIRLIAFNMREAAEHFGVDPGVIAPRKRSASIAS